jgi:hypothetical protein
MNNRYIYLIFSKTGTWLSRLISAFSDIRYPHASLSFDSDCTQMYSFGRINPNNPFSGGFVVENLHDGVFSRSASCECMILRVKVTDEQYLALQKYIEKFSKEKDKYKYNFLGLYGILLNKPLKRKNYYFCSQFISEALIKSNVLKSEKDPELTRTDDLYSIKNREILYEGFINERYRFPVFTQI